MRLALRGSPAILLVFAFACGSGSSGEVSPGPAWGERGGAGTSCTEDAHCGPGSRCQREATGEFRRGTCVALDPGAEAVGGASASGPPAVAPSPAASSVAGDAGPPPPSSCRSLTTLAGTTRWVGSMLPAARTAADDGQGTAARLGYVLGMRYAKATDALWVHDGRIRIVDAAGNVTTRYDGPLAGSYANIGVDSAGNGYVYTGTNVRKLAASGGPDVDLAVTRPTDSSFRTMTVGLDDHVYVVFSKQYSPTKHDAWIVDVTDGSKVALFTTVLSVPTDIAVDRVGRAWVADPNHKQVRRFDLTAKTSTDLYASTAGWPDCNAFAMAVDDAGNFYADRGKYAPDGTALVSFDRGLAYGLAASATKVWVPYCTWTSAWGCELHVVAQP